MIIKNNLPIDIINTILSYDNRFSIRIGKVMNKINKEKYKEIIIALYNKPKITTAWIYDTDLFSYKVYLSTEFIINYDIDHKSDISDISFTMYKKKYTSKTVTKYDTIANLISY